MNAETRAKELLAAIVERGTGGWRFAAEIEESLPLIATALRQAENEAHEMDAEWCEHGARKVWQMMKDEGVNANLQTILRVCQAFASTIRTFKHEG